MWSAGDAAQCVVPFPPCEGCGQHHAVPPQYMNVYTVSRVIQPHPFHLLMGADDVPHLELEGLEKRVGWHCSHFRKPEPLPPEEVERTADRPLENV